MENFNTHTTLNPINQIMEKMGLWPKQLSSVGYQLRGFISVLLIGSFSVTTLIQVFRNFSNLESTSFGLCVAMSSLHSLVKYCFLFLNKTDFFKMLDYLTYSTRGPYKNHLNVYLIKKIRMCNKFRRMFLSSSLGTGIVIIVAPLFYIQSKRPLPVHFPADIKEQPLIIYFCIFGFQSAGIILTCLGIACFDGLLFTFIAIAAAQLRILRETIIQSTDCCPSKTKHSQLLKNYDIEVNKVLKQCVIRHLAIERYLATIEETFQYGFLIQLLVSLLVTCLIGFNFVIVPLTSIDFGRCLLFFVAACTQLIFFCVPGNEIILQSEKINDACYMTKWDNCGPSVRKTLFIIMERSKRPFRLTAANFMELSLNTLMTVFKSAFSYFTVLQQMYSNSNTSTAIN